MLKHLRVCRVQKGIGISMDKKKTGNLIREARQRKNYTQSELGRMLGVTNKAVSRWENGVGTLTMLGLVYRYFGKEEDVKMIPSSQLSRGLGIASLAMLLWSVGIMYLSFEMVRAGSVPLGMELSSLGPFLNNQLCAGYALNVIFLAVEMYRLLMERTVLHPGCVISPAVIYLDFFYIDILGRMDTLDSVWKALDRGTVLILLEAVSGIVFLFIQSHRSRSHASDSPHQSQ